MCSMRFRSKGWLLLSTGVWPLYPPPPAPPPLLPPSSAPASGPGFSSCIGDVPKDWSLIAGSPQAVCHLLKNCCPQEFPGGSIGQVPGWQLGERGGTAPLSLPTLGLSLTLLKALHGRALCMV